MSAMFRRSRPLYSDAVTDYMTGCVDHLIIGSSSGYQTDYQVMIRVYRGYGANSSNAVYIPPSECRSDFSDIRFADTAGRLLPYWIETTGTNYADIWVKLYQIPTTGAVVRVLFGGGAIASGSSGSTTFPSLFDHFDDSVIGSIWERTSTGGSATESGTVLTITGSGGWENRQTAAATYGTNTSMKCYLKLDSDANYTHCGYGTAIPAADSYFALFGNLGGGAQYFSDNGSGTGQTSARSALTDYHTIEVTRNGTTNVLYYYDGSLAQTHATKFPTGNRKIGFAGSGRVVYVDWVFVRSYINPEPSHCWWGSLEDL